MDQTTESEHEELQPLMREIIEMQGDLVAITTELLLKVGATAKKIEQVLFAIKEKQNEHQKKNNNTLKRKQRD